jgi:hypothetical protein
MRIYIFLFYILYSCAYSSPPIQETKLTKIQEVWDSKDPKLALKYFPEIKKLSEEKDKYLLGIGKAGMPTFGIYVSKKDEKIQNILFWLDVKERNRGADYLKTKLLADDWKSIPIKSTSAHVIEKKISHNSEKLGVSFIYDDYDPKKRVWIVYWGADPAKINF